MKTISIIAHIILGALFIFSGITKIIIIEPFEYKLVEQGIPWEFSLFLARFIIGLEWALGFWLLFYWNFNKKVWIATAVVLLGFTGILFVDVVKGDNSNCGCFGEILPFTPLQGILKNILFGFILFLAWKFFRPLELKFKKIRLISSIILGVFLITLPFIVNSMNYKKSSEIYNRSDVFKLGLDTLYQQTEIQIPTKELREGKQFIAYLSLTCPHCKVAAQKIGIIQKQHPEYPLYIILNGPPELEEEFITSNKIEKVPHYVLRNRKLFYAMAGFSVPTIYWVQNDSVYATSTHLDLNSKQMGEWLKNH